MLFEEAFCNRRMTVKKSFKIIGIGSNNTTRVISNYSSIVTTSLPCTVSEKLAVIAPNILKVPRP